MAKITVMDNTKGFHIFQPSDSRRWVNYRVTDYGCEVSEYEDIGNGEVKKYPLATFQQFQWVKQDKDGIDAEIIKTESRTEEPEQLDPFTQAALDERVETGAPDYVDLLSRTPVEEDEIPTDWPNKAILSKEAIDEYNSLKKASDAKKPKGHCHQCNTQFIKGHPSKKFCDSKCKDAFHNKKRHNKEIK